MNTIIKKLRNVLPAALRKPPFRNKNIIGNISRPPVYIPLMNVKQERMLGCEVHTEEPLTSASENKQQITSADNKDVFRRVTENFSPHQHMLAECQRFLSTFASLSLLLQIPADGLKIEPQFMVNDPVPKHIVDNLADLAARLEITTYNLQI